VHYFIKLKSFFYFRDKFQNSARPIQPLNKHHFEIKKKVWSVDPNEQYDSSTQLTINEIDVSKKYSFYLRNICFFVVSSRISQTKRRYSIIK
jgi:hypothetical protein